VAPFGTVVEVDVVDVVIATDGAGIEETTDATTMSTTNAPPRPSRSVQFAARPPPRDLGRVGRPAPSGLASSIVIGPILACREGFGRSGTWEPPGGAPQHGADTDVRQPAMADSRPIAQIADTRSASSIAARKPVPTFASCSLGLGTGSPAPIHGTQSPVTAYQGQRRKSLGGRIVRA